MSVLRRKSTLALGILALVASLALALEPRTVDREVVLVSRQMAFYAPGESEPNPVVTVGAGERVRIVLTNEDRGMVHDLSIGSLDFRIPALAGDGSSDGEILNVPETPGRYEYVCTFHEQLMRGVLRVVPRSRSGARDAASGS